MCRKSVLHRQQLDRRIVGQLTANTPFRIAHQFFDLEIVQKRPFKDFFLCFGQCMALKPHQSTHSPSFPFVGAHFPGNV